MKKIILSLAILVFLSSQAFAQDKTFKYTIDTNVDEKEPLVGQQLVYNIIITENEDLQYSQIAFEEEAIENWDIVELKTPTAEQIEVGGKPFKQVKFSYAIFPQKSGEIKLPIVQIVAYKIIKDNDLINKARHSRFAFLENDNDFIANMMGLIGQRISTIIKTPEKTINVLPSINNENSNWWLPSKNVEITSNWEYELSNLEIKQPIKRTIEIKAIGVTDVQIPNLDFKNLENLKIYPEKPIFSSIIENDDIISSSITSVVYISSKSGDITIPQEIVYWYNTNTKKFEKAILPEEKLYFFGDVIEEKEEILAPEKLVTYGSKTENKNNIWQIPIAFIFGIFFTYIIMKPKKPHNKTKKTAKPDVIKIAKTKDLKDLEEALIVWAKDRFKQKSIMTLQDIKKHIQNENMQNQIDILSKAIYSKDTSSFDETAFIKAFKEAEKTANLSKPEKEPLPRLYK